MSVHLRIGFLASVGITHDSFFPEIVAHLRRLHHSVFLGAGTPSFRVDSTTILGLSRRPSPSNWRARSALRDWVRENDLSVVVTSTATASILARLFVRDCPVVYFCHGLHWDKNTGTKGAVWKMIETAALKRTAGVITLNSEDEQWFKAHAPDLKAIRLPFGVGIDPNSYPRTLPRSHTKIQLCWIGEFIQRKNPADAVRLADTLRRNGISFHLDMLGHGTQYETTKTMVEDLGLEQHITLRGHTPVERYLTNSDALIHTARWEGLPRVFLEALAVGRPIFSYDIKGARDIPWTHLTPYGDTDAMAAGIAHFKWDRLNTFKDLPRLEALSYTAAAEQIAEFVEGLIDEARNRY